LPAVPGRRACVVIVELRAEDCGPGPPSPTEVAVCDDERRTVRP